MEDLQWLQAENIAAEARQRWRYIEGSWWILSEPGGVAGPFDTLEELVEWTLAPVADSGDKKVE